MDKKFGTWYVRSMYRPGSLRAVAEEISKCKLDYILPKRVYVIMNTRSISHGSMKDAQNY
jgi:hypothetical protein